MKSVEDEATKSVGPIRKSRVESYWTTESEKNFINGIGTFTLESHRGRVDLAERKVNLLFLYRNSMLNRKKWGKIDPKVIMAYVNKILLRCGIKSFPEDIFDGRGEEKKTVESITKEGQEDGRLENSRAGRETDDSPEQRQSAGAKGCRSSSEAA